MNGITIGITERGDAGLDLSWEKEYKRLNCYGAILITKNLSQRFIYKAKGINSIVHATITGHGKTALEPRAQSLEKSSELFAKLVHIVGTDRAVLRIDPIIPTPEGIATALKVYETLGKYGTRIRISFLDNYPHVKARFQEAGIQQLPYQFHAPLEQRIAISKLFPGAEVCGEPGMGCTGCISSIDLRTFGITLPFTSKGTQRAACQCLAAKRELLNNKGQCSIGCLYCYWK